MKHYAFDADTDFCGTENTYYEAFEHEPTEKELNEMAEEIRVENGASFEYLLFGWDYDPVEAGEMTEAERDEEIEDYYASCTCTWREISQEEYEAEAEVF